MNRLANSFIERDEGSHSETSRNSIEKNLKMFKMCLQLSSRAYIMTQQSCFLHFNLKVNVDEEAKNEELE